MPLDPSRSTRRTVLKSAALGAAACMMGDGASTEAGASRGRRKTAADAR